MIFRVLFLLALLALPWRAEAFVFYRVGGNLLRWNVNAPGAQPSVVNPTTKAIRYYIASDVYSTTNRANEINAIRAAFDQWQLLPGTSVKFEFSGFLPPDGLDARFDNTNVIFWAKKSLQVASGSQSMNGRQGWTSVTYSVDGSILDADIVLNGIQYVWYTDPTRTNTTQAFVESTILHEIGHLLGLDHSTAGAATVFGGSGGITTELGLSADEIAALRYLYPAANTSWASIRGKVRMNGSPVLGAMVIVEDAAGNVAGATVSDASGDYLVPSLAAGNYNLRATPFDPPGPATLLRGEEIALDYTFAVTSFLPTTNFPFSLTSSQARVQDVNLTPGEPATRIHAVSKPAPTEGSVTTERVGVSIQQGQSNFFTGVVSRSLKAGSTLRITGDGITHGQTKFLENKFGIGLHALVVPISVSSNATPGLRSFVVSHNTGTAYANGFLEVAPALRDDNLDGLDDRFQRLYWSPWTTNSAAPAFDADADLFSNSYEYRTGTNPTNRNSFNFRLNPPLLGRFGATVSWPADSGKRYQLFRSDRMPPVWQPLAGPITATNQTMTAPDLDRSPAEFYRLQLLP